MSDVADRMVPEFLAMRDEIVRLRKLLETVEAEREQAFQVAQQNEQTARRLGRILAALREPSEAVLVAAAKKAFTESSYCDFQSATQEQIDQYAEIAYVVLAAAVAAAERETSTETPND